MRTIFYFLFFSLAVSCQSSGQKQKHDKVPLSVKIIPQLTITQGNCPRDDHFLRIQDAEADSKGNIYILDNYSCRIWKFDSTGKYLLCFGEQGSGKGEFESPTDLIIDSNDNVYVLDGRLDRISVFDRNGQLLRIFKVDIGLLCGFQLKGVLGPDDELILSAYKSEKIFQVYDKYGKHLRSFGDPMEPSTGREHYKDFKFDLVAGSLFCSDGFLYCTSPFKYEIQKWDVSTGRLVSTFTRSLPEWRDGAYLQRMPQGGGAFVGGPVGVVATIVLRSGDIINVVAQGGSPTRPPDFSLDVFNKDGKWLGEQGVDFWALSVGKDGKVYCVIKGMPWKLSVCRIRVNYSAK